MDSDEHPTVPNSPRTPTEFAAVSVAASVDEWEPTPETDSDNETDSGNETDSDNETDSGNETDTGGEVVCALCARGDLTTGCNVPRATVYTAEIIGARGPSLPGTKPCVRRAFEAATPPK